MDNPDTMAIKNEQSRDTGIKNEQSRDTGNIEHTWQTQSKHNTEK
jgi:hypothetical protein